MRHCGILTMLKYPALSFTESKHYENAAKYNGQLKESSKCPKEREIVLKKYKKGYQYVEKWYRRKQIPINVKENIRKRIPSFIKKFVRKFI